MSPDRVIYSFVLGWVVLIAVLIVLDWLGNPNRGAFRPKGERPMRDRATRKTDRAQRRLEDDASVRAALRDAYGASSLRLSWSADHETKARQLDDALIVEPRDDALDVSSREVAAIDRTLAIGDPLPNPAEEPPPDPIDDHGDAHETPDDGVVDDDGECDGGADAQADDDRAGDDHTETVTADDTAEIAVDEPLESEPPAPRSRGWRVGANPLSLTARGDEPAPATVRTRVWKNHGASKGWSEENRERLRAGKPPRRVNPITGRSERAIVDVETGRATWGSEPTDPFGAPDE